MNCSRTRSAGIIATPDVLRTLDRRADPVEALWQAAQRLYRRMDGAYTRLDALLRQRPNDHKSISKAQGQAEALGQEYAELCERICKTDARTLKGVLAKLRCATHCVRDIVPPAKDLELVCDIELRLVFSLQRDLERILGAPCGTATPVDTPMASMSQRLKRESKAAPR
jgi:hypothetical protein